MDMRLAQSLERASGCSPGNAALVPEPVDEAIIGDALTPTTTSKFFPWEQLAFEIREQIFVLVHVDYEKTRERPQENYFQRRIYTNHMPPLVVAFRRLPISYDHILQWFTKFNKHLNLVDLAGAQFTRRCFSNLTDMTASELACIKSIDLNVSDITHKLRGKNGLKDFAKPTWFTASFLLANNLREVSLSLNDYYCRHQADGLAFIAEFPFWLEGCSALKKLTLTIEVDVPTIHSVASKRTELVRRLAEKISEQLGVNGIVQNWQYPENWEPGGGNFWCIKKEVVTWEVLEGEGLMDWTKDLGSVWRRSRRNRRFLETSKWSLLYDANDSTLEMRDGQFVVAGFCTGGIY